ncbi:nucleotidyltransferase domain-containing protein [Desulfosoma sp.]
MERVVPQQTLCDDAALRRYCRERHIRLAVLFGSWAQGKGRQGSDVDVAVLPARGCHPDPLQWIFDFQEFFFDRHVDLVVLSPHTDPLLLCEIFFTGRPLYEDVSGVFQAERIRAWKLYLDTAPLRRRRKSFLEAFIERKRHDS